jgi:hypothetical protein
LATINKINHGQIPIRSNDKVFIIHPYNKGKGYTTKDIWTKDKHKIEIAKFNGFSVLTVWESEYRKDPKQTLEKCIEFINGK